MSAACSITYIGGPTALIEVGSLRLLTDPTFDPAGGKYSFGIGVGSRKTEGPALSPEAIGSLDAVVLSHDQHGDNLDNRGREVLAQAFQVITTESGGKRLGDNVTGLRTWETTRIVAPDGFSIRVTATPARHGIPGSRPIVGETTGFVLEWPGQQHGALYISGDTVYYGRLKEIGERYRISAGMLHLGAVRFPLTGPARYTMTAAEAVRLADDMRMRTVVPIHYEDWAHFREPATAIAATFEAASRKSLLRWLKRGEPVSVEV